MNVVFVELEGFSSVQLLSHVQLFATHGLQHARPPCPLPTPGVYSNSCPLMIWWSMLVMPSNHLIFCHPLLLLSSIFPSIKVFSNGHLFTLGCQSIGVSASTSVLPMNTQDWFPLGWTGLISLQSKELSRVFSNTTVQKHQFLVLSFLCSPTLTSIQDY